MILFFTALALADVPPDPGYVETCTIPIQCGPDIEGQTCRGVRPDVPPEPDCDALAAQGWVRMCSAWGGTVYDVVMCREQPDPAALAERIAAAERAASCGACDATSAGAPPLALLLALALARRARRG